MPTLYKKAGWIHRPVGPGRFRSSSLMTGGPALQSVRATRLPVRAWAPLAVFGLAAALRLAFLDGPFHGDEAVHYAVARHWGADPANVYPPYRLNEALWWQRPLFAVLFAPGAALGLAAFRAEQALVSALLPVLVLAVARAAGVRPWLATGAALATALHPALVLWGARVVPDPAMGVLVLAGILAHQRRRPVAAAALLLAAAWVKETAALALVGLLAWTLWAGRTRGEVRWWPLELDRPSTALLGALLLAPLPSAYAVLGLGGRLTGWDEPLAWAALPGFLATAWLLAPLLAGLLWRPSRPWAALALAYLGLAAALAAAGFGTEPSSVVLPVTLGLLGSAAALEVALRPGSGPQASRRAAQALAAALAVCLVLAAAVPGAAGARAVAAPGAPPGSASLPELAGLLGDDPLGRVLEAIPADGWGTVFLVDPDWYHVHHPFAARAGFVGWAYTTVALPPADWAHAVEGSDTTVLQKVDRPLNHALRATYADCVRFQDAVHVLVAGDECPGRTARLQADLAQAEADEADRPAG